MNDAWDHDHRRRITDPTGRLIKAYDRYGRLVYAARSNAALAHIADYTDAPHQPPPTPPTSEWRTT
jgi:hypothetical protein